MSITAYHQVLSPFGGKRSLALAYWYRPDKYVESDAFLVCDPDLPRWTAVHRVLGTYAGGVFTAGDTASDCATYYGYTGTTVGLRPKIEPPLPAGFAVSGSYELDVTWAGGAGTGTVAFNVVQGSTDLVFVLPRRFPAAEGGHWVRAGLVESVDDCRLTSGAACDFTIVADPPAVFARSVPITNQQRTPYVLPWGPEARGVKMATHPGGTAIECVWSEGTLLRWMYLEGRPHDWADPVTIASGDYTPADISVVATGQITVLAVDNTDDHLYQWDSADGGKTWTAQGQVG